MPRIRVNDVELFYEVMGEGDPLVLVHGSWGDHSTWQGVVPALATSFRLVTYDRRGHSQSGSSPGQGSRQQDEDDLAALVTALDCAPAHVVGNSFGASIVLGLAVRRPELFRTVMVHEPPLSDIIVDQAEAQPILRQVQATALSVLKQLERGDVPGGTRRFVEEIVLGPGTWQRLPEETRAIAMSNASTFLDEQRDPAWASLSLIGLSNIRCPALLTQGDQSPAWFRMIVAKLEQAMKSAEVRTVAGAGHLPQVTHSGEYVATLTDFLRQSCHETH